MHCLWFSECIHHFTLPTQPNFTTITLFFCIAPLSVIYLWSVILFKLMFMQTISLFILILNISFYVLLPLGKLWIFTLTVTPCPVLLESVRTWSRLSQNTEILLLIYFLLRNLIEWVSRSFSYWQNCRYCLLFFRTVRFTRGYC